VLTGVLWYSTAQKWSPCYQKVHANRVRVIRRHLYIKPRTSDRAKKIRPCNPRVCVKRVRVNEVLLYKFGYTSKNIKICYLFKKFTLRTCNNMTKTIVFTLQEKDVTAKT